MTELSEFRVGRNFIRIGDTVRCKPKVGTSFKAVVTRIRTTDNHIEVEVVGGKPTRPKAVRTFTPDSISRVAQTKNGVRKDAR